MEMNVADILFLTDRADDVLGLVSGLEAAGHRVGMASPGDPPGSGPEPDFLLVDAVKDFSHGRDSCRRARAAGTSSRVVALIAHSSLDAVGPDWDIDTFIVDGSSIEESIARLRLAMGPQTTDSESIIRVGELMIDPDTYQVRLRGRPLDL